MKTALLIFLLSISLLIKGQQQTVDIIATPILMEFKQIEKYVSGFFYLSSNTLFFVTAKHVLYNSVADSTGKLTYSLKDSTVSLYYYSNNPDIEEKKELKIDLYGLSKSGNIGTANHKDIAIGRIGKLIAKDNYFGVEYNQYTKKLGQSSSVNIILATDIVPYKNVKAGSDIYILGYPKALGLKNKPQYDFSKPLIRKGIVAGKNNILKTIVVDCTVYPGNSGSPVFQYVNDVYKLIGIAIEFIPEVIEWKNSNYGISNYELINSGYSVVESIEDIEELIRYFK